MFKGVMASDLGSSAMAIGTTQTTSSYLKIVDAASDESDIIMIFQPAEDQQRQILSNENNQRSLINELPLELLQAIFFHSLPQNRDPDPTEPPLLLCQVCLLWRAAAFGVPRLWNNLSLLLSRDPPDDTARENTINIAHIWMQHAKILPISLSLTLSNISNGVSVVDNILTPYSYRFISLTLLLILTEDLVHFLTLPHGSVDQLERLTLHLYSLPFGGKPMTVFQFAPRLKSVLIKHINEDWFSLDASHVFLPWSRLTRLDIRSAIRYRQLRPLFRTCSFLEHCHLCVGFMEPYAYADYQIVKFPYMIELSLDMMFQHIEPFGIQDYDFPNVVELEIMYADINEAWIQGSRQSFRFENLRRLNLDHCTMTVSSILLFLRTTPNLTELTLWLNHRTTAYVHIDAAPLWEALTFNTVENQGINILTKLQVLELWIWVQDASRSFPRECLDMIKSRCISSGGDFRESSFACLQSTSLHLHIIDEDTISAIEAYLEPCSISGLELWTDTEGWSSKRYLAGEMTM